MQYEPGAKTRFYQVKTWEPPSTDQKWGSSWVFGVVARSAVQAMETVQTFHPTHRIDAVNSTGVVHHVVLEPAR